MGLNQKIKLGLGAAVVLIGFLIGTESVHSESYIPESSIALETRLTDSKTSSGQGRILWQVIPEKNGQEVSLSFQRNGHVFCRLLFSPDDEYRRSILLSDPSGKRIQHAYQGFLPVNGLRLPFHMIDPTAMNGDKDEFKIIQTAGGRKFATSLSIDKKSVTVEDAITAGWLNQNFKKEGADDSQELILYTVFTREGGFLFRQLWESADTWWLFEETANERTWRK